MDTLEYLQRGGRIGRASAFLGTILSIKPILGLSDGVVVPLDRRRTAAKARARLLELVTERPLERVTVLHTLTPGIEAIRDEVVAAAGLDAAAWTSASWARWPVPTSAQGCTAWRSSRPALAPGDPRHDRA